MAIQNEGRRLVQSTSLRPHLDLWLVGRLRAINAHVKRHSKIRIAGLIHQGRNNARLPGHNAGHYTAQPSLLLAALGLQLHKSQSLHFTVDLRPSPAVNPAVHHCSRPTRRLFTTQQPCSMPQPTSLEKTQ